MMAWLLLGEANIGFVALSRSKNRHVASLGVIVFCLLAMYHFTKKNQVVERV